MSDGAAPRARPEVVVLIVGVVLCAVLIAVGFPAPHVDDAWFKGPAAELAQHGRLASPSITGFFPHIETIYACYPPLPQLLLAAWYLTFGVTLRSSLAWSLLVHLVFSVAITRIAHKSLGDGIASWRAATLGGLIWLANLSLLDRQEELALCWLWLDTLLSFGDDRRPAALSAARSGLLVGLAALSSPFGGLLSGCAVGMRIAIGAWESASSEGRLRSAAIDVAGRGAIAGPLAAGAFGAWAFVVERVQPGVFDAQFLGAMRFASKDPPFPDSVALYASTVLGSAQVQAFLLPAVLVTLVGAPLALIARPHRVPLGLLFAAVIGSGIALGLRPAAYTYLWASAMVTAPCLAVMLRRYLTDEPRLGLGLGVGLMAFAWVDPAHNLVSAATLPADQRPDAALAAIQSAVPEGELVAVTARHWSAFQGRNPWREVLFLTRRDPRLLDDCTWMVLREGDGVDRPPQLDRYELVSRVASEVDDDFTYAYSVWRLRPAASIVPPPR